MKHLTLIRHAKSSWSSPDLSDHDRPLNHRGEKSAPKIGRILAQREDFNPDFFLSSTAVRALTTARIIAEQTGFDPDEIQATDDIYLASSGELIRIINNQIPETATHAVLFGHNPGFEIVANTLLKPDKTGSDPVDRMPTCSVARLSLDIDHWANATEHCATLIEFLYPKMFA